LLGFVVQCFEALGGPTRQAFGIRPIGLLSAETTASDENADHWIDLYTVDHGYYVMSAVQALVFCPPNRLAAEPEVRGEAIIATGSCVFWPSTSVNGA
jgi:hypothetical protein